MQSCLYPCGPADAHEWEREKEGTQTNLQRCMLLLVTRGAGQIWPPDDRKTPYIERLGVVSIETDLI